MIRFLLLTFIVAICVGCSPSESSAELEPAKEITLAEVGSDGQKTVKLSDYKGKVVLLDFWATWCGPCLQLIPTIESLEERYGKEGLVVLSLSQEPESTLVAYQQKAKPKYPLYRDVDGLANGLYDVTGIPRSIVINREGNIVADIMGADATGLSEAVEAAMR